MVHEFTAHLADDARAALGEGPIWDSAAQKLYWIDILGKRIHIADPEGQRIESIQLEATPGTVMPTAEGGLLVATDGGVSLLAADGSMSALNDDLAAHPDLRFNDGKVDPRGRAVVGTLSLSGKPGAATLYALDQHALARPVLEPVTLSNGLGWSPDGQTFYFVDTPTGRIDAFDYDLDRGALSNRRVFAVIPGIGLPDGLCVDDGGGVWVALWGGSAVLRFDPAGELDARIHFDIPNITSCAFGGADRSTLFITTAAVDVDPDYLAAHPHAGGLFRADVGRTGPAATPWKGLLAG